LNGTVILRLLKTGIKCTTCCNVTLAYGDRRSSGRRLDVRDQPDHRGAPGGGARQGDPEADVEIEENNAQRRAALAESAETPWKGAENRARPKALKESVAQMPPFRRPVGPSTRQHITFNPAHVEPAPGKRPKTPVWTPEQAGAFLDFAAEGTARLVPRAREKKGPDAVGLTAVMGPLAGLL
jgi:hypothetical protein